MPAPANISAATATALGDLPATVTQTVDFAGTTYTVWYSFVAPAASVVIGAFGFGDLSVYRPTISPWEGDASSPTQVLSIAAQNLPIQFPVTPGSTYFLKLLTNGGNPSPASLSLNVQVAPNSTVPIGTIAVNDDTSGFPLALVDATANETIRRFVSPFPAGEQGDVLEDGTICVDDIATVKVKVYTNQLDLVSTLTPTAGPTKIRTCLGLNQFYVGMPTNPITVKTVTAAGAFGATTYSLTGKTTLTSLAASNDGTILYYSGPTTAISRWDLPGAAALSDLAAILANYAPKDILVLSDDTIVVSYYKATATRDFLVKHYSAAGATLNTYTYGSSFNANTPKLAYAIDDPNSFWAWFHPAGADDGISRFVNTKVSDGSALTTRNIVEFEGGTYTAAATAAPVGRFGPSFSCPFWIMRAALSPVVTTTTYTIRRQRRFLLPSSDDNKNVQIPTLELLMRTGIGVLPDAWGSDTPLGANPQVMMRLSKDGGKTWGPERWVSAGRLGKFLDRVRWTRATGNYRSAVCEITVDAPCDFQFLAMLGTPVEGSS